MMEKNKESMELVNMLMVIGQDGLEHTQRICPQKEHGILWLDLLLIERMVIKELMIGF